MRSSPGPSAAAAQATAEMTRVLDEFLAGASRSDVAMHKRFWADDLIHTTSAGDETPLPL